MPSISNLPHHIRIRLDEPSWSHHIHIRDVFANLPRHIQVCRLDLSICYFHLKPLIGLRFWQQCNIGMFFLSALCDLHMNASSNNLWYQFLSNWTNFPSAFHLFPFCKCHIEQPALNLKSFGSRLVEIHYVQFLPQSSFQAYLEPNKVF